MTLVEIGFIKPGSNVVEIEIVDKQTGQVVGRELVGRREYLRSGLEHTIKSQPHDQVQNREAQI